MRAYCIWFLVLAFLGPQCLRANVERTSHHEHHKLVDNYLTEGGAPSSLRATNNSWALLIGSILGRYGSLLDWIRNHGFSKNQVNKQLPSNGKHPSPLNKRLFVFGDSLFDAGNTIYIDGRDSILNKYPYGFTYFSNGTGRVCDGRVVPDFIANYANLPLIPPILQPGADFSYGANFASVNAVVLDSDIQINETINFVEQIGLFKSMVGTLNETLGAARTREILGQAVYILSIGGVDYGSYFSEAYTDGRNLTLAEEEQFVQSVIGNITEAIIEMYELGARKFAFQNVAPLGCIPAAESLYPEYNGTCIPMLTSLATLHNRALYNTLTSLAENLDGLKFSVMDYFHALYDRITDPSKFGFDVGRFPCYNADGLGNYTLCEYPSAYVFFNGGHTTQHTNEQLSKLMWDGDASVTRPYTVKRLFEED